MLTFRPGNLRSSCYAFIVSITSPRLAPGVNMFGVVAAHPTTALVPSYAIIDPLKDWTLVKVLPNWQAEHFGVFALMPSRQFVAAKT